jgi:hypothetical protein
MANSVQDIDRGWKAWEKRVRKVSIDGVTVKLGILGANASRVHPPAQILDKKTEKFLNREGERGNVDAVLQLQALRDSDATKRLKHIFKPGPTMAELGEIFEFGLGNNPERSWLRNFMIENGAKLSAKVKRVAEKVVTGEMTAEQGMNLLGLDAVGGIKKRIQANIPPPLAPSTLARKGPNKTTPLIDTGMWIGSITHEVVPASEAKAGGA